MAYLIQNEIVCANCGHKFDDIGISYYTSMFAPKEMRQPQYEPPFCPGCGRMIFGTSTDIENDITFVDVL